MHESSFLRMKHFVSTYVKFNSSSRIVDVGSYNIGGSYRDIFEGLGADYEYIGLDIVPGPNVDIVVEDPYCWKEIEDESVDCVISGQAFEHIEYPWRSMAEIYKKLKPSGVVCIIAPNSLAEHRYPTDCYRYFSDGLSALAKSAGFNVVECTVAGVPYHEIGSEWDDFSNDVCLIAVKGSQCSLDKVFPVERYFNPIVAYKLQYEFLSFWKRNTFIDKIILKAFSSSFDKKLYITGDDILNKELLDLCDKANINVEKVIPTVKKTNYSDLQIPLVNVNLIREHIEQSETGNLIITAFDSYGVYIESIKRSFPNLHVSYLYDLIDRECLNHIFEGTKDVYLYGAGHIGTMVLKRIEKFGFKPTGYVVSKNHRSESMINGIPVFEIDEISKDSRIIISMESKNVIESVINEFDANNIFDGKQFILVTAGLDTKRNME